jgi:hypothetical protein
MQDIILQRGRDVLHMTNYWQAGGIYDRAGRAVMEGDNLTWEELRKMPLEELDDLIVRRQRSFLLNQMTERHKMIQKIHDERKKSEQGGDK